MTQPTTETTEAGTRAPNTGLLARLIGVVFSPRETFGVVVAHPTWFAMLALVVVLSALVSGGFMLTPVGQQAWLDQMEKQGTPAQQLETMQRFAPYVGYFTMGMVLIAVPVFVFAVSGILFAIFTVGTGGNATYKQMLAVFVHSQVIGLVGGVLKLPLNYLTKSLNASTNLGVFFPMLDDTSFLARLSGMVDLFMVWWVVVLAVGVGVLYKRRTGPIAVAFFLVYALIAVGYAALTAARS